MKETINNYINTTFRTGLVIVLLATFFLFTNFTSEAFDTPKFLILLLFILVMLIATAVKYTLENRVEFKRTPFDLPLILLLVVGLVSTIASKSPFVSLLGYNLRAQGSLISLAVYILFYFVLTQNLKSLRQIKSIFNLSIVLGVILSILTLAAYFGLKALPFTTTGSNFSTAAILALLLPLVVSEILNFRNFTLMVFNAFFLTLFGITIALTGSLATWVAGLVGFIIVLSLSDQAREVRDNWSEALTRLARQPVMPALLSSLLIIATVVALSFIPPLKGVQNPFYSAAKNLPREVQLDFVTSWKIAASAFRDSPFWGTGPSTFLFNFTTYKPAEFNSTKFWNIRFESAFNEFLQILSTLGGVGLLAFVCLAAFFLSRIFGVFSLRDPFAVALGASGVGVFVILLLHAATLPVFIVGLLILACFWTINDSHQGLPFLSHLVNLSSEQLLKVEALPSILLTVVIALVIFSGFFSGKFFLADWHHKNALAAVSQNNGVLAYNELLAAESLNPWSDSYRTDLAQVNFALANAVALAKAPSQASPSGSLTDQDKQNIQTLLQQSINEGKEATALSPRSAVNWEILALLYRQIAGVVQNALLFSLDSYGRAILNDPFNPVLRLNVGGVYYATKNYDLAVRFFTDAINLKPDFANAYYNLSVALRDKGDLSGALQAAEKLITLVDKSSSDYKTASDYLADLKSKAGQAGGPAEPPAATASGALQGDQLPKVINLPKPEKIATPEAIKKPNPTPSTQP